MPEHGMWLDGICSSEEMANLQSLIKKAAEKFGKGQLPWEHVDDKLTVKVWRIGSTLHFYYSWNVPPLHLWKPPCTKAECLKCFPYGRDKDPQREAWCESQEFGKRAVPRCPYGVPLH